MTCLFIFLLAMSRYWLSFSESASTTIPPFLKRLLWRLKVAPMQLNTNVYQILIYCFFLWVKYFCVELPFSMFQNLHRIKITPSSTGSYYLQDYQGTFFARSLDSDKSYKHLRFYVTGKWLSGRRTMIRCLLGNVYPSSSKGVMYGHMNHTRSP